MSSVLDNIDEVVDSLTGHEEMAILQHFGRTVGALADDRTMLARACVFVQKHRAGANQDDARNQALDLTLKDVLESFETKESDEVGKDEAEPEQLPASSLSSVS